MSGIPVTWKSSPALPVAARAVLAPEAWSVTSVTSRPFVQDFACDDATACIVVDPGGGLTPPFACAYSEVKPDPYRGAGPQPGFAA